MHTGPFLSWSRFGRVSGTALCSHRHHPWGPTSGWTSTSPRGPCVSAVSCTPGWQSSSSLLKEGRHLYDQQRPSGMDAIPTPSRNAQRAQAGSTCRRLPSPFCLHMGPGVLKSPWFSPSFSSSPVTVPGALGVPAAYPRAAPGACPECSAPRRSRGPSPPPRGSRPRVQSCYVKFGNSVVVICLSFPRVFSTYLSYC